MTAKKGIAPCGHPGTHITNTFVVCDLRCEFEDSEVEESDGIPFYIDPEKTQPLCPFCRSDDVEEYGGFITPDGKQVWHCHNCQQGFAS